MYVMKKDGQHYVYVRDGKTYVSTVSLKDTSMITVYLPDGVLLTNASITLNGVACMTDSNGIVSVTGEKGKPVKFQIWYNENFTGEVETRFGVDASVSLIEIYLLTVTATGFKYSNKFTITTTINGVSYTGSLSMYLAPNTSITIKSVGESGYDYSYSKAYVIVDGTSIGKSTHTFTMDTDHVITFEDGVYSTWSVGT